LGLRDWHVLFGVPLRKDPGMSLGHPRSRGLATDAVRVSR
jgi:hypothetical protein